MDAIASYVLSQYKMADRNRRDLQIKWENNRRWFSGNLYPDGDKPNGDEQWKAKEGQGWRSDTSPGTTHSKVIAAFVICLDTVLAGGQIPFMMKPSKQNKNRNANGVASMDAKSIELACDGMTTLIQNQFNECKADKSLDKNLFAMALYGESYAKMRVKEIVRSGWEPEQPANEDIQDWSRIQTQPQWKQWTEKVLAPCWDYITNWDIFRDWETDNMYDCSFIIHRQIVDNWWLNGKKGKAFFNDDKITAALNLDKSNRDKSTPAINNNADTSNLAPLMRNFFSARTRNRQLLEFWGRIPRPEVESYEKSLADLGIKASTMLPSDESSGDEVECHAMVIDGVETIRFTRTEPQMRPFAYARWEDNCDEWTSRGVADNCHEMSKVIRGTFRAIEDNTKLSGNVMTAVKRRFIKNMPKSATPGLFIELAEECDDARKAIQPVIVPDVSAGLINMFRMASEQNESDSMVPRIAQGQLEDSAQTAQEASIRQAQSLKYIGMAIRNCDSGLIEPMVEKFYTYNMNDPNVAEGKGNYLAQALGFTSFQNKTERLRTLNMMLDRVLASDDLKQKTKIEWIWTEMLKAVDMDPDQALKSDEEMQQEQQNQQADPMAKMAIEAQAANIEKTQSDALKNKSVAAKNMADANALTHETGRENLNQEVQIAQGIQSQENGGISEPQ